MLNYQRLPQKKSSIFRSIFPWKSTIHQPAFRGRLAAPAAMDLGELRRLCGARHGCHGLRLLDRLTPVVAAAMGRPRKTTYTT